MKRNNRYTENPRFSAGKLSMPMVLGIAVFLAIVLVAVLLISRQPEPKSQPEPETATQQLPGQPGTELETVAPAQSAEERGDSARELITRLEASEGAIDYAESYSQAQAYRNTGRLADAQLLYFFAARGGYGPAAFDLATMYDPNHFSQAASLMEKPDPFQAYKWYMAALEAGIEQADARLDELRDWAEEAARAGDTEAERLLLLQE